MRHIIHIVVDTNLPRREFLRAAAAGLTSTNDAGEEIVVGIEAQIAQHEAGTVSDEEVAAMLGILGGNVKRTAEALGMARSTVRARAKRAGGKR